MRTQRGSFRTVLTWAVSALLFAGVAAIQASTATATTLKQIDAKGFNAPVYQNSLGQTITAEQCGQIVSVHFVITQVLPDSAAPPSIAVTWGTAGTTTVLNSEVTGKTAHYLGASPGGAAATAATAFIYDTWNGEFNLSHINCKDVAHIAIGPSAVNDIGAGQTSHTFTVNVTGTATLANPVNIAVTVPGATISTNTCGAVVPSTTTATCAVTITSSAPAGPFTAHATASGTVGIDAFSVATDGVAPNSTDATKLFACKTHSLTLTATGAGKSQTSYDNFTGGTWLVSFDYTLDGGTNWVAMTPVVLSGSGLGNLVFTAQASVPTPDAYTATASWRFTIKQGTTVIFGSGLIGSIALANSGDCSASDTAVSPVSNINLKKANDVAGLGNVTIFSPGLSGWTLTATSGTTVLTATTATGGSATISGLDDLVAWQICETAQDGWIQTFPSYGGCYTRSALPGLTGTYLFGNTLGTSTTATALKKANGDAVANGSALPLGTSMMDTATVTTFPTPTGAPAATGSVTFTFYTGLCRSGAPVFSTGPVALNALMSDVTGGLAAGDYYFQATYTGDNHYAGSTSECEPFHINKADLSLVTTMYSGQIVLSNGGQLPAGTLPRSVRDTATASGLVDGFAPANNVTFQYFTNGTCANTGAAAGSAALVGNLADGSATESITAAGGYSFLASIASDSNYNGASAVCESFTVTTVTINKLANGGNATFGFTLGDQTPSVTTTGTPGTGSTTVVVLAGPFTLGETSQDGWQLVGISCAGGNAAFTAAAGTNTACNVENTHNGATRTQGFWATHTDYANAKWASVPTAGAYALSCVSQTITANPANGQNILMGSFWSNIANTTTGAKRTALGKARMQLLQQLTAALLNKYGLGADDQGKIAAAVTAYCGISTNAITTQTGILSTWNQSGDTVPLTGPWQGSATTSKSKSQANLTYWDTHNQ